MRLALLAVGLLLVSGCASGPSGEEPGPTTTGAMLAPLDKYSYRGTQCVELGLDAPVAAANVQPYVPSKYKLRLDPQGRATLSFAFARCDRMVASEGAAPMQVVQVDVAVHIEGGAYEIAYTTNHRDILANTSRVAFPSVYAPTSTLLAFALGSDGVQAHIRGGNISIDADATSVRAPITTTAGGTYHHSGPNGTSIMRYDVKVATLGAAHGTMTTQPGGLVAKLFGGTKVTGTGIYGSFTLGANLTRVPD